MTGKEHNKKLDTKKIVYITVPIAIFVFLAVFLPLYFVFLDRASFSDTGSTYLSFGREKAVPGEVIRYRLDYKNSGRRPAKDLYINMELPEGTGFVSVATPDGEASYDESTDTVTIYAGDISPGDQSWVELGLSVEIPADDGTMLESGYANLDYLTKNRETSYSILKKAYTEIESAPVLTDLDIGMVDLNGFVAEAGDRVRFVMTLKNTGTMDAIGIELYNEVPQKIEVIESSIEEKGLYNKFNSSIVWDIDNIKAGTGITLAYEAILGDDFDNIESFTSKVTASGHGQKITADYSARVLAYEDLSTTEVTVTDVNGHKTWAWDRLRYKFTIRNTGKRTARDFKLVCPIPQGTGYITGTATGDNFFFDDQRKILQWNLTGLKRGEVMEVSFDVNVGGYLTGGGNIEDGFTLTSQRQEIDLKTNGVIVEPYVFQTLVLMGDSHIALNDWPETLAGLLEITYPHAVFNIIEAAVAGEMAVDAIDRFDSSVRIHNPDIIILGYGTNDAGAETGFYRHHMNILVEQAKSTGAEVLVYNIGYIDTSNPRWSGKVNYIDLNHILEEDIASSDDIGYIDLYGSFSKDPDTYIKPDGMHWTEDGEQLAANIIFRAIYDMLDEDGRIIVGK